MRRFLQKPSPEEQHDAQAVDRFDRSILDIGVMSLDAKTAVALLGLCGVERCLPETPAGDSLGETICSKGLDIYCEVCCALGSETTPESHRAGARAGGSKWNDADLGSLFEGLASVPFHVQVLPHCVFLHFGTMRQLVSSGLDLVKQDRSTTTLRDCLSITNEIEKDGRLVGADAWVEGCRIGAELRLEGGNVLAGLDVADRLEIPRDGCLDVLRGTDRAGAPVWFVRCYRADDDFKSPVDAGASIWGLPAGDLPDVTGAEATAIWDQSVREADRAVWNARLFPAVDEPGGYRSWLWLLEASTATEDQWRAWRGADRFSLEEIATLTDQDAFHERRARLRSAQVLDALPRLLRPESEFSAGELTWVLGMCDDPAQALAGLLTEAYRHYDGGVSGAGLDAPVFSRVVHTIGSAMERLVSEHPDTWPDTATRAGQMLAPSVCVWLSSVGLDIDADTGAGAWFRRAKDLAFAYFGRAITSSGTRSDVEPRNALRKDEIVWGRAPARLDLGGGWSDTPPYSLERGGSVINAAIDLNGQPPIQAYARVIDEPVIRLASIDFGKRVEIRSLDELLDYRHATSEFSLPKAALALSGFSPEAAAWPGDTDLRRMLEAFGGGIELTTLAAIPGGSGLGTSSIMGAVILAVVRRLTGNTPSRRELFHGVLQLEQALTTGGGWQDQIGGAVNGVKVITTQPGLVPDPLTHFVPGDILDPRTNGNRTLLYYTGITRLAKNILHNVVGRYLDRERAAMATLRRIHAFPARVADAMARKDLQALGHALATAWDLKKQIDPGSTNEAIEALLERMAPYVHGVKLMGAGGGGFLLVVCRSEEDSKQLRDELESNPPNDRARFFDFGISAEGLVVTVC